MSMKADKHYAKPDPGNFQARLMIKYEKKVYQVLNQSMRSMKTISWGSQKSKVKSQKSKIKPSVVGFLGK